MFILSNSTPVKVGIGAIAAGARRQKFRLKKPS